MKLICEVNEENLEYIAEAKENGEKDYKIKGVFMQGEIKNRNGRVYPMQVLDEQVQKYKESYIDKNRAYGELGHPNGPTINLERVSHMITDLKKEGNNYIGEAKIMDTPYGKIVKNLMDEGASLGVSSRGMGSLKQNGGSQVVQKDYHLATAADIVADPSAPDAFVEGIMEGKEWVWDNGVLREAQVNNYKEEIKKTSKADLEGAKLKIFTDFLSKL
jgi:hypothetical protein|tara:strand:+ start:1160 stop:1810 length:651 start_codon:yes stop_codon:yes gene_type:complete